MNTDLEKERTEEDTSEFVNSPSALSLRLADLKKATLRAVNTREHLPQPLFWSLFSSELAEIKAARREQRLLRKILYGVES